MDQLSFAFCELALLSQFMLLHDLAKMIANVLYLSAHLSLYSHNSKPMRRNFILAVITMGFGACRSVYTRAALCIHVCIRYHTSLANNNHYVLLSPHE